MLPYLFYAFKYDYNLNNKALKQVQQTKDLGIIFYSKMTFSSHIDYILSNSNKMLGFIIRICKEFKSITAIKTIYFSLVHSKLNFASIIWNPQYLLYKSRLESVQNRFVRYLNFKVTGQYDFQSSSILLKQNYHITSLENRRLPADVIFLHKLRTI